MHTHIFRVDRQGVKDSTPCKLDGIRWISIHVQTVWHGNQNWNHNFWKMRVASYITCFWSVCIAHAHEHAHLVHEWLRVLDIKSITFNYDKTFYTFCWMPIAGRSVGGTRKFHNNWRAWRNRWNDETGEIRSPNRGVLKFTAKCPEYVNYLVLFSVTATSVENEEIIWQKSHRRFQRTAQINKLTERTRCFSKVLTVSEWAWANNSERKRWHNGEACGLYWELGKRQRQVPLSLSLFGHWTAIVKTCLLSVISVLNVSFSWDGQQKFLELRHISKHNILNRRRLNANVHMLL